MAHFALLWKARTIEKYRQNYENEKINSMFMSRSDLPDKTLFQKWKHYKHGMQKRLSRTFSKWYPEGGTVSNFFVSLRADMKLPSILLRSFYGFIGGLCLTYLGFMFFVFQLSLSMMHATVLSSVLGVLLTLGLTFSNRMRCLIFLLVPQLFSRVGRYTLTCYALVLILTGPATNTLRNCEVLSTCMACTQERIKISVKQINDSIKKPYNSIKDSLKNTIRSMNVIVNKLKKALIRINRLILSIASIIESNFKWFIYVADICNDDVGTPHNKCLNIMRENSLKTIKSYYLFDNDESPKRHVRKSTKDYFRDLLHAFGVKNVKTRSDEVDFGGIKNIRSKVKYIHEGHFGKRDFTEASTENKNTVVKDDKQKNKGEPWFMDTAKMNSAVCASLKSYKKFFVPADFTEVTYVATIRKKLKAFVGRLKALLHMKLNIQHTYSFIGNNSSYGHVPCGVVTEIKSRADPILTWLSWSSCVTSLFLLLIIFRAKHYQRMFETRSRFDNRFITKEFRELDLKRLREGRETVLPLNVRERAKYVTTTSFRLVASEKLHLNRSAVFMTITTFKLLIHVVADYSLYWVLATITHHGNKQTTTQAGTSNTGASITGQSFVSRLLQSLLNTMNAVLLFPRIDKSCFPNPHPPDVKRYCQIGFLIFLLWFFALFEPYGLRMRHLIMGHYRPQRAKDRAAWLYNHILRTRASFMKFARRKLHREYKYSTHRNLTLRRWLQSYSIFRWLSFCMGIENNGSRCLLCNVIEDTSDVNKELIRCEVPNCPGKYCPSCFTDIGQLCTICLSPTDYGDFSDASLELGSSEDDDNDDEDPDRFNDRGLNRRYKRDPDDGCYQNESYLLEDQIDEELASSSRISKQKYYSLGRKGDRSDTIPLLKHSNQQRYSYDTLNFNVHDKIVKYKNICLYLCKTLQKTIEQNHNPDNETPKILIVLNVTQYSLYEITKHPFSILRYEYCTEFGKYLRKNKLIRRKKYVLNEDTYWQKINKITIREVAKKHGDGESEAKNNNNYLNISKKIAKKHIIPNTESNELNKNPAAYCRTKNDRTKVTRAQNNKKSNKTFHSAFKNCWNNFKWPIFSIKFADNKRKEPPIKNNKRNRRKKRKKSIILSRSSSIGVKLKKKRNCMGNSRLFAYLDERDWVKSYESGMDLTAGDGVVVNKDNVIVNNIMIPRLELDLSNESINEQQIRVAFQAPAVFKRGFQRNEFCTSRCAIGKFIKSIICSSCEFLLFENSSEGSASKHVNAENEIEPENLPKESNFDKKLEDFTSMAKCDLHPEIVNAARTKAMPFSSSDDVKYGSSIKRSISNSLSLIRTIYSSLSLSTNEKKSKKLNLRKESKKKPTTDQKKVTHTEVSTKIKPEKSNLKTGNTKAKTGENKSKKSPRAVLFIKEGEEPDIRVSPKQKVRKNASKAIQLSVQKMAKTFDKSITAFPTMVSCGCQNIGNISQTEDLAVQVTSRLQKQRKITISRGLGPELTSNNDTCTCAVQCHKNSKDVGTCPSQCQDTCNDVGTLMSYRMGYKKNEPEDKLEVESLASSTTETPSSETDGNKTDTTIYSLTSVDYRLALRKRHDEKKRYKVKVTTKSNKSTATERANRCDVSTATYDWWSPIVERKCNQDKVVDRKKKVYDMNNVRERKTFRSTGIMAGDKSVKFRSQTQFIPSRQFGFGDIMSPSRYLLESQKYYNELFYNIFTSPRIYPVTNIQKFHHPDRERHQSNSNQRRRRGRKSKRLEDSYTPRRNFQPGSWKIQVAPPENRKKSKRV